MINSVDFIDESEKSKWIELLDDLNQEEMKKIYTYFKNNQKKDLDTALTLIFEDDLEDDLHEEVDKITKKYINKFKK
ncbi:hypothetical protein ACFL3T_02075 [Patescibacteria group bacterium]